jgi:flavin reductase
MNAREQPAIVDANLFRRVMGRFATGVTIITCDVQGDVRGMTANAFMSGSLAPPLCLVSIAVNARMHEHLITAGRFGVSILAKGQEGLSLHFAGHSRDHLNVEFERVAMVPLLKGASAIIAAQTQARHDCGDHTLFVGRIMYLRESNGAPLVYCSGKYGAFVPSNEQAREPTVDFW